MIKLRAAITKMYYKLSMKTRRCSTTKLLPVVHVKNESFHFKFFCGLCLPIIQKSLTQFSSVLNCDYMKNYEAQFVYIFGEM